MNAAPPVSPATRRWLRLTRICALLSFLLLIFVGSWEGDWEHPELVVLSFVWIYGAIVVMLSGKNLRTGLGLAIGTGSSLLAVGFLVLLGRLYHWLSQPPAKSPWENALLVAVSALFVLAHAGLAGSAVKTCRALGWKVRETRRVAEGCTLSLIFYCMNALVI